MLIPPLLLLVTVISSCGENQEKQNIYNDHDKIVQEGDRFTFRNRTDLERSNNKIDVKYSGFSGAETIWIIESKEDSQITFSCNSTVGRGYFKTVLIHPDKRITTLIIGNQQGDRTTTLIKGKYVVKMVGRNAEGQVNISVSGNAKISKETFD